MPIGGMEVFGHDYHFGATPTKEGVSKSKGIASHPTKGKHKGKAPSNLKPHKGKTDYGRFKNVKPTGNEYREPKGPNHLKTGIDSQDE